MNIPLPDGLKEHVDTRVLSPGFCTTSEYLPELIGKDQDRQQMRALLLAGAQSALTAPVDSSYFGGLRNRISSHKNSK